MSLKNLRVAASPSPPGSAKTPVSPASGNASVQYSGSQSNSSSERAYASGSFSNASSIAQLKTSTSATSLREAPPEVEVRPLRPIAGGYDFLVKIAILGDPGVGKSTFLRAESLFDGKPGPIEGVWQSSLRQKSAVPRTVFEPRQTASKKHPVVHMKTRDYKFDERIYRLVFWDCPGTKEDQAYTAHLVGGALAVYFIFDLTSESTFNDIEQWNNATLKSIGNAARYLIGNKDNCMSRPREVSKVRAELFARKNGMIYFEIDAKSNIRCSSVFRSLFSKVIERTPRVVDPRLLAEANVRPGPRVYADPTFRQRYRPLSSSKNENAVFSLNWL